MHEINLCFCFYCFTIVKLLYNYPMMQNYARNKIIRFWFHWPESDDLTIFRMIWYQAAFVRLNVLRKILNPIKLRLKKHDSIYLCSIYSLAGKHSAVSGQEKQQRSDLQLSERLGPLGIVWGPIEDPLKCPVHHSTVVLRGWRMGA